MAGDVEQFLHLLVDRGQLAHAQLQLLPHRRRAAPRWPRPASPRPPAPPRTSPAPPAPPAAAVAIPASPGVIPSTAHAARYQAWLATSVTGCRTVVSWGMVCFASSESSKPTTARSRGTFSPSSQALSTRPRANWSVAHTTAVEGPPAAAAHGRRVGGHRQAAPWCRRPPGRDRGRAPARPSPPESRRRRSSMSLISRGPPEVADPFVPQVDEMPHQLRHAARVVAHHVGDVGLRVVGIGDHRRLPLLGQVREERQVLRLRDHQHHRVRLPGAAREPPPPGLSSFSQ